MKRKDSRAAEVEDVILPPAPPRPEIYHCLTLRPGETEDEARAAYGVERLGDDKVFLFKYVSPRRGHFHPDDLRRPIVRTDDRQGDAE